MKDLRDLNDLKDLRYLNNDTMKDLRDPNDLSIHYAIPIAGVVRVARSGFHLEKGVQTPMAQGRSTKIISMIQWIRTSRLSIKNSPFSPARSGLHLHTAPSIFLLR